MTRRPTATIRSAAFLLGCALLSTSASAKPPFFPQAIAFQVNYSPLVSGTFDLSFDAVKTDDDVPAYLLLMKGFAGLGFKSSQEMFTWVDRKSLSLLHQTITEPRRDVRLDRDCQSAFGEKTECFVYKAAGETIQTEIFTTYKAIDLMSSILVATRHVATGRSDSEPFNFIFRKVTKQVVLTPIGTETIDTGSGDQTVTVLGLRPERASGDIYKFYIGRDDVGHYPAKVVFIDDAGTTTEFVAVEVHW